MNKVLRNSNIAGLCLALSMFLVSAPASAQLMLAHEGHHEAGGCKIENGDFPVEVSVYEVPEGNIPPMHSYCNHIPNAGKINMTVELSNAETREVPIAVRVLMEGHENSEHGAHEVLYMPAEKYTSGIIVVAANLEQLGQYNIHLETEDSAGKTKTAVKIPLHVGGGGDHDHGSNFGTLEIILLAIVAGVGGFIFVRSKKAANA